VTVLADICNEALGGDFEVGTVSASQNADGHTAFKHAPNTPKTAGLGSADSARSFASY
jgi:hypothetical protein